MTNPSPELLSTPTGKLSPAHRPLSPLWIIGVIWLVNYLWLLVYWNAWYSHNEITISISRLALLGILDWSFWWIAAPLTLWLARRFPPVRSIPVLLIHLPLSIVCAIGAIILSSYVRILIEPVNHPDIITMTTTRVYSEGSWYFLFYWFVIGVYFAIDYHAAYRDSTLKNLELQFNYERLQRSLVESRLSTLRAQLQPHFLFNALHSVSSLMESNVLKARTMLIDLAELLRLTLEISEQDSHPLADEFDWIERYMALQAERFGGNLTYQIDLDSDIESYRIPCLVVQPLVENALKHAVQPHIRKASSIATIHIQAFARNNELTIAVTDNGAATAPDTWKEGYGLKFVRETLAMHNLSNAKITFRTTDDGGSCVQLTIPITTDA